MNQLRGGITTASAKDQLSSMKQHQSQQCQFVSEALMNEPGEIQAQQNGGLTPFAALGQLTYCIFIKYFKKK